MIKNKTIWTYWHQGFNDTPFLVRRCIEQWKKLNPNWTIHLLDKDNVNDFIERLPIKKDKYDQLSLAHRSDLIRTQLLIQHGGIWADPTCFPVKSLDEWLHQNLDAGLFLFHKPGRDRIISNWFIAANENNDLLKKLLEELCLYWNENEFRNMNNDTKWFEPSVKRIYNRNLFTTRLWFTWFTRKVLKLYPYMIYHYTFYKLITTDDTSKILWNKMPKISADGPHRLQRAGLLSKLTQGVKELIDGKEVPLFKLTWKLNKNDFTEESVLSYLFLQ
jgi:hypothetical protein